MRRQYPLRSIRLPNRRSGSPACRRRAATIHTTGPTAAASAALARQIVRPRSARPCRAVPCTCPAPLTATRFCGRTNRLDRTGGGTGRSSARRDRSRQAGDPKPPPRLPGICRSRCRTTERNRSGCRWPPITARLLSLRQHPERMQAKSRRLWALSLRRRTPESVHPTSRRTAVRMLPPSGTRCQCLVVSRRLAPDLDRRADRSP